MTLCLGGENRFKPVFTTKSPSHEDSQRKRHRAGGKRQDAKVAKTRQGRFRGTALRSMARLISGEDCHKGNAPSFYTDFTDSCVHGSVWITQIILERTIMTTAGFHHEDPKTRRSTKLVLVRLGGLVTLWPINPSCRCPRCLCASVANQSVVPFRCLQCLRWLNQIVSFSWCVFVPSCLGGENTPVVPLSRCLCASVANQSVVP